MTINDFVKSLVDEIEQILKDNYFKNLHGEEAQIKGYPYELPIQTAAVGWGSESKGKTEEELFPYFLVQIDEISYEDEESLAKVWVLFAVYDEAEDMAGWENITNAVEKVINRFRTNPVLQDYYYCEHKMKAAYPENGSWPHFFAGIEMDWNLPDLEIKEV